jgi:cell division protein FtsL
MQTVNRKRIAMKKLLMEENDRLQKQLSGLIFEKEALAKSLKTRIHHVSSLPFL